MTFLYEGMNYWKAAFLYKLTHPMIHLRLIGVEPGQMLPSMNGYDLDRARLFYNIVTKKVIEIRRG